MTLNDDGTHVSEEYGMDEKNPASWEDIPPVVMHPDGAVDFGFDSEWVSSKSFSNSRNLRISMGFVGNDGAILAKSIFIDTDVISLSKSWRCFWH